MAIVDDFIQVTDPYSIRVSIFPFGHSLQSIDLLDVFRSFSVAWLMIS
ncbi:hypothetical protein [Peribacillus butanolivorans]|nr:hypothetical protein [Peribacillus butanolivorans]